MICRSLLLAASLMLSACVTEYAYTPPATAEGRSCAVRCQSTQVACRTSQDRRAAIEQDQCKQQAAVEQNQCLSSAEFERQQCDHDADIEYGACLRYTKTDADRASCHRKICTTKTCNSRSCYNSASYGLCDSDFRTCYQTCGGQVRVVE